MANFESSDDLTNFFITNDFAVSATYTVQGGSASTIKGVFDKEFIEIDTDEGSNTIKDRIRTFNVDAVIDEVFDINSAPAPFILSPPRSIISNLRFLFSALAFKAFINKPPCKSPETSPVLINNFIIY